MAALAPILRLLGRAPVRRLMGMLPVGALASVAGIAWVAARARPLVGEARPPVPPSGLPPARIVDVPGVGEMFLRDTDPDADPSRPVVVLLHGWMFPADLNWHTAYRPLSEVARVLAVDHRGHGRGLRPSEPFRLTDAADDVAALLRHLGTPPAVAVGYSMGGPVAQLLWQRDPDVVAGVVLCATSATFNVTWRDRWTWRLMGLLQLLLRIVPRHWWERMVNHQIAGGPVTISRLVGTESPAEVVALLPWVLSELDRGSAEDVAEAGRELSHFDSRGWLGTLDVPAAIVVTIRDGLVPLHNQRALAALVPHALVVDVHLDHEGVVSAADVFIPALRKAVEHVLAAVQQPSAQEARSADPATRPEERGDHGPLTEEARSADPA